MMDYTNTLPDECLALIFNFLKSTSDRNNSSLVSHRWLRIDAQTRRHLRLNAQSDLQPSIPSIFTRFNSLTKLALHSDHYSSSIDDQGLSLIASLCPKLTHLKLIACYNISSKGLLFLSQKCRNLNNFSCSSGDFGAKGIITLLNTSSSLEELSVEYIHYTHQFEPFIIGTINLKTLKLIGCLGDWGRCLDFITISCNTLLELHLEGVYDLSKIGLLALSKFSCLQVLHLQGIRFQLNDVLTCAAQHCKYLKKLYINNRFQMTRKRNDGLFAIAKYSLNLEELVLIGVDACCNSLEAIAVNCRKLERLHLCSSDKITDLEISCIADKCVALRTVLIKQCCVSDKGVEAFALGCPNLVEIRVTKCKNVTHEVKDRLRARRGSLVVELDGVNSECNYW